MRLFSFSSLFIISQHKVHIKNKKKYCFLRMRQQNDCRDCAQRSEQNMKSQIMRPALRVARAYTRLTVYRPFQIRVMKCKATFTWVQVQTSCASCFYASPMHVVRATNKLNLYTPTKHKARRNTAEKHKNQEKPQRTNTRQDKKKPTKLTKEWNSNKPNQIKPCHGNNYFP